MLQHSDGHLLKIAKTINLVKKSTIYIKPGSYLLSLEVKAPGEVVYTLIDTIQLDILADALYKLPEATMKIATTHRQSSKPILFSSTYSTDHSTKVAEIIWGFGDGTTAKEKDAVHTYTNLQDYSTFPVIFRVTDENGFKGYAGVIVAATKGSLHFVDNLGRENTIPVSDTIITPTQHIEIMKQSWIIPVVLGGIACIVIIFAIFGMIIRYKK